jgi:cytokinin dehydrogenase
MNTKPRDFIRSASSPEQKPEKLQLNPEREFLLGGVNQASTSRDTQAQALDQMSPSEQVERRSDQASTSGSSWEEGSSLQSAEGNFKQEIQNERLFAHLQIPAFEGTFSTEEADRALVADDFGHALKRYPWAVLSPHSSEDVVRVVQFARQNGLKIAPRGQGHSTSGQAQVEAGIVVDLPSLNRICALHSDRVEVETGVRWKTLLQTTLKQGLTPPVLPDYLDLSIGGVLSVGGIGGTSYRYGAIVDHVLELQVVTGTGCLETCSPTHQRDLFESVLAGHGQCGIIVKAILELVPAHREARVYHLSYPDLKALIHDQSSLLHEERFDFLVGQILQTDQGTWSYVLEGVNFSPASSHRSDQDHLLQGLDFIQGKEQVEEKSYDAFSHRVIRYAEALKEKGVWNHPHPWCAVFVPASQLEAYVSEALAEVSPADFRLFPILLSGLHRKHFHTPLLRIPAEETFFLVSFLRSAPPSADALTEAITQNRELIKRCHGVGGTCYPIGTPKLSPTDWKTQFGPIWDKLQRAKEQFDPDHVLTPGPGIFPT